MRKIYRLDSDYTNSEVDDIINAIPKEVKENMEVMADSIDMIEIYLQEDGTYHISEGLDIIICILDEYEKEKILKLTDMVYERSKYSIKDISESVLFEQHTEKEYKGVEDKVKKIFDRYLDVYLDHDTVLDKINMLGMTSLSERDKKVLESANI